MQVSTTPPVSSLTSAWPLLFLASWSGGKRTQDSEPGLQMSIKWNAPFLKKHCSVWSLSRECLPRVRQQRNKTRATTETLQWNHWWKTTVMRDHPDERPQWWETTLLTDHLMRDHPDDRPPDERPHWWQTNLLLKALFCFVLRKFLLYFNVNEPLTTHHAPSKTTFAWFSRWSSERFSIVLWVFAQLNISSGSLSRSK